MGAGGSCVAAILVAWVIFLGVSIWTWRVLTTPNSLVYYKRNGDAPSLHST